MALGVPPPAPVWRSTRPAGIVTTYNTGTIDANGQVDFSEQIHIECDATQNQVQGNFIGVDASGSGGAARQNHGDGILINGASYTTIDANTIANNFGKWC